ncbi:MAG: polysaccharide deacetylase, partial [Sedimentibacter sp.]|uniref:polysaccharide deacetylase family protein n=1 Tax=Sedimentibacter sp. TaxID=1960295 RepID=UPI002981D1A8
TCKDKPKTLSMGQYGMTNGLERVLDVLDRKNIKATFFVPGKVAEIYESHIRNIVSRGHEIACSGYDYINFGLVGEDKQKQDIMQGVRSLEKIIGKKPLGFRAPVGELTMDTLRIARSCGMKYSSDLSDDDRPYSMDLGNGMSVLQIPVHWALYDLPYFAFNYTPAFPVGQGRIANYSGVLHNWKEEFEGFYNYGLCYVLQLEPQTIGNPARIKILEDILEYIGEKGNVWYATGEEMYKYMEEIK